MLAAQRRKVSATVTVGPRVGVATDVSGQTIRTPGRANMLLDNGRFASRTAGSDYLANRFHRPAQEEAWRVLDTTDHISGRER